MGTINWGRVIGGGLAAGLLMNISQFVLNAMVYAKDSEEAMRRLNLQPPPPATIAIFIGMTFVVGVMLVWLYAAIRPRYGPGPKTAVCAGFVVWFLARFLSSVVYVASGIFPARLVFGATAWGLVEVLLAGLLGGWLYKEA